MILINYDIRTLINTFKINYLYLEKNKTSYLFHLLWWIPINLLNLYLM